MQLERRHAVGEVHNPVRAVDRGVTQGDGELKGGGRVLLALNVLGHRERSLRRRLGRNAGRDVLGVDEGTNHVLELGGVNGRVLARLLKPGEGRRGRNRGRLGGLRAGNQVEAPAGTNRGTRNVVALLVDGGHALGKRELVEAVVLLALGDGEKACAPGLGCRIIGKLGVAREAQGARLRLGAQHLVGVGSVKQAEREGVVDGVGSLTRKVVARHAVLLEKNPDSGLGGIVSLRLRHQSVVSILRIPVGKWRRAAFQRTVDHGKCCVVEVGGKNLLVGKARGALAVGEECKDLCQKRLELVKVHLVSAGVVGIGEGSVPQRVGEVLAKHLGRIEHLVELSLGDLLALVRHLIQVQAIVGIARVQDGEKLLHALLVLLLRLKHAGCEVAKRVVWDIRSR